MAPMRWPLQAIQITPEEYAAGALKRFHVDCICEHEERVIADMIRRAIIAEREACAQIAEAFGEDTPPDWRIARAIRSRDGA